MMMVIAEERVTYVHALIYKLSQAYFMSLQGSKRDVENMLGGRLWLVVKPYSIEAGQGG